MILNVNCSICRVDVKPVLDHHTKPDLCEETGMTEKKTPAFINAKRRGFLQGAAVAGGTVASGAALSSDVLESPVEVIEPVKGNKGYERNEYVKRYYARARF